MADEPTPRNEVPARESQNFVEVWIAAVTRPSVATYENITSHPNATTERGMLWVFLSATAGVLIASAIAGSIQGMLETVAPGAFEFAAGAGFCGAPLFGLWAVVSTLLLAAIIHAVAKSLGGTGTFPRLAYAIGAYRSPLILVGNVFGVVPLVGPLVALLTIIYSFVLNVIAVKAVHQLTWEKSAIASLVLPFGVFCVAVGVIVVLALLGPAIGNVFSTIIEDI